MGIKELTDEKLVVLLREGNILAYEEIYRRHWYKTYSWAKHQVGAEDAEELVQELFLSLWNRRNEVVIKRLDHDMFDPKVLEFLHLALDVLVPRRDAVVEELVL